MKMHYIFDYNLEDTPLGSRGHPLYNLEDTHYQSLPLFRAKVRSLLQLGLQTRSARLGLLDGMINKQGGGSNGR